MKGSWLLWIAGGLVLYAFVKRGGTMAVLPSTPLTTVTPPGGNVGAGCLWLDYTGACTADPNQAYFDLNGNPILNAIGTLPAVQPGNTGLIQDALSSDSTGY